MAVATGDTTGMGDDHNGSCSDATGPDVALLYTAPHTGNFNFSLEGSAYDTQISVHQGCGGPELICDDDGAPTPPASAVGLPMIQGQSVAVVIDGNSAAAGTWQITVSSDEYCRNGGDDDLDALSDCDDPDCWTDPICAGSFEADCADAIDDDADGDIDCDDSDCTGAPECSNCPVDVDLVSATGPAVDTADTTGAGDDVAFGCLSGMGNELVYAWTAPSTGWWAFDTFGSSLDTALAVFDEICGLEFACDLDSGQTPQSRVNMHIVSGSTVRIVVDSERQPGTFVLNIDPGEDCTDLSDNDGDGLVDCADEDCDSEPSCTEMNCGDSTDNDADGDTDCADPDCAGFAPCAEQFCADTVDDDSDGDTDCDDTECLYDDLCITCSPTNLGSSMGPGLSTGSISSADDDVLPSCGMAGAAEVEFAWTAPYDGTFVFDATPSNFPAVVSVRLGGACTGTELACQAETGALDPAATAVVYQGEQVLVSVEGVAGATGTYFFGVFDAEDCDDTIDNDGDGDADCTDSDCTYDPACQTCSPSSLGSALGASVASGTTASGHDDDLDISCSSGGGAADVEYTWTAPATARYIFDTDTSSYNTVLQVMDTDCAGAVLLQR